MNRATSFELGHFPAVPSYRAHEESQTKDEHKQKKVHGRVVCRRARRCEEEKHYRQAACVPERKRLETEPPVLNAVGVGSASSSCVGERPAFACFPCSRYESIIGLGGMWWRKKKGKPFASQAASEPRNWIRPRRLVGGSAAAVAAAAADVVETTATICLEKGSTWRGRVPSLCGSFSSRANPS